MLNKIKARRFISRKSQDQLSVETSVPQPKISKIENGFLKANEKEKKDLAKALECRPEELFD